MARFLYNAMNAQGIIIKNEIEADSINQAEKIIQKQKLVVLKIREKKNLGLFIKKNDKLSLKQTSQFVTNFSIMMGTGLSLTNIVENLIKSETDKKINKLLENLYQNLRKGESLANSIRLSKPSIQNDLIEMIESAENNGKLSNVMQEVNLLLNIKIKLKQKLTNALIYPSFLFLITIIVFNIILTQIIPQFALTFQDTEASLPLITHFLFNLSYVNNNYGFELALFFISNILIIYLLFRNQKTKIWSSELLLKIPYVNKLIINSNFNLFCRQMSINLMAGLQIDRALELTINSLSSNSIKNKLAYIPDDIRKGNSLSVELKQVNLFPAYSLTMISAGEETGRLIEVFDTLSNQISTEIENNIERLSKLIEPTIIIIIGIIVSIMAFGILSPILTLNEIV